MKDEKVLKTLMFLYENETEEQYVFKIENVTSFERFTEYGVLKSEVNHGYLCLLILKNVQNKNKKDACFFMNYFLQFTFR